MAYKILQFNLPKFLSREAISYPKISRSIQAMHYLRVELAVDRIHLLSCSVKLDVTGSLAIK